MLPASSASGLAPDAAVIARALPRAPLVSLVVVCDDACHAVGALADEAWRRSETAFELVVVDATTGQAARSALAAVDKYRARVVRSHGRGATGARNVGLSKTSGEFLCVLGAADVPDAKALASAVETLKAHPRAAFAACGTGVAGRAPRSLAQFEFPALLEAKLVTGPVLVRRSTLEAIGGFDERLPANYQDWDTWITCIERGFTGLWLGPAADGPGKSPYAGSVRDSDAGPYRQLVAKHAASYSAHLASLLEGQEREEVRLEAGTFDLELADYLERRPQLARAVHDLFELERRRRELDPKKPATPVMAVREADEERDAALRMAEHLVRERDEARRELAVLRLQQQLDAAARAEQPSTRVVEGSSPSALRATLDFVKLGWLAK